MKKFLKLIVKLLVMAMITLLSPVIHAQYMDYFSATPIVGSLSSTCWGAAAVGPRDQSNGLEDKTLSQWVYWDGGIIKGPDGIYHMFASRWNQANGHQDWANSLAIHATSSNLYGPYTDRGICWPNDQGGKGHNVFPFQLKDGRYAILVSDTRPGDVFISNSLDGPWTYMGKLSVTGSYASSFRMSNVCIMIRPDGRYEAIQKEGAIGIADNVLGPYNVSGPPIWQQVSGLPTEWQEDPVMWYSGGQYHIIVNKWDTRKAYHITSSDGISNWKLSTGYAYDPTANFIRYTNGTVNHWNKIERPNVYMENGHVVSMTFAVMDVDKDQDLGNDKHGSKIIVVPFNGAGLDSDGCTATAITPYLQVNGGAWQQTSSATVASGATVKFGPQPASGGSWSWSGCGTSGTSREQTVNPTGTCTATATYTNTGGCQSTQNFTVTVSGSSSSSSSSGGIISGGIYRVTPRNGGKALDVSGCATTDGANVQNWSWLNNNCQKWQFTSLTGGYWRISPINATSKALDVSGVSTADGANVHIWAYGGGNNQQWQVVDMGNGYYQIKARHSGKCLDLAGGSTLDGANIQQWTCSSSNTNEQFTFTKLNSAEEGLTESLTGYMLYPSPVDDNLHITFNGQEKVNVRIYNNLGALALSSDFTGDTKTLDVSKLTSGMYFIRLEGNEKTIADRFIKK